MAKVFVSYRRSDADAEAGRIADHLCKSFGEENVFHDHEALEGGLPWKAQIDKALDGADATLVVIGPGWLDAALPEGKRRLEDPDDMVVYEIGRSIERSIRVLPLLVRNAGLPDAAALPERLRALPSFQWRKVQSETFGADMNRVLEDLTGARHRRRDLGIRATAAIVAAVVLGVAAWQVLKPIASTAAVTSSRAGASAATAALPEERSGTLALRIKLGQPLEGTAAEVQRFLLWINEPVHIPKAELPPPRVDAQGVVELVAEDTLLPLRGERYEADVRRQPLSAALTAPLSGRTTVCLKRTAQTPLSGLRATVECTEGERCGTASDNPGHFEACEKRVIKSRGPAWSWIGSAFAESAAEVAWVIPSIETLRRRSEGHTGPAFTEIRLTSPPLPDLNSAKEVSVKLVVNGRNALIDGLPPDASAVPFDPSVGLRLAFGLENLDFAGAKQGHDEVDLVLRFLDGKNLVREAQATLKYIALRDQPEAVAVGDGALGIRWTAKYNAGRADDRFQVFITSSEDVDALVRAKRAVDAARMTAKIGGTTYPLVGVVRPPLGANKAWGLNVGLVLNSGQVRFTFDDGLSAQVCHRLAEIAASDERLVRRDSYRRSVDNQRRFTQCAQFYRL